MKAFDYYKVKTVAQAVSLLARHQEKAAIIAGGSDMLTMMKDRVEGPKLKAPQHVLDVTGIKELNYVKEEKNGLKIGAATILADIASSPVVAGRISLLAQAAGHVAVPQIRNVATLGGNLCQRPRCWYFRGRLFKDCFRKGGDTCYALAGENQYHALFGAENCCMVHPSDTAVALTALGGRVEVATPKGSKFIPLEQFYTRPGKNLLKETVLGPAEMVVAVEVPSPAPGVKGVFLKLKERKAFDFAIVSVAAQVTVRDDVVSDARIVLGGVAPFPWRSTATEAALKGKRLKDAIGAACSAVVQGASPLGNNGYKAKATQGIVEEALNSVA